MLITFATELKIVYMKYLSLLISLSVSILCVGQVDIIGQIQPLLQPNTINQAEEKINEFLKHDSLNVDALMLKGNVIFSKYGFNAPSIMIIGSIDESIFETAIGSLGENKIVPDEATANDITKYYLKAVSIDKTREDIQFGICYIYSISLMTDKLINYLPILKEHVKEQKNLPFTMSDYAINLIMRNRFEDGMKVYLKIADLFPDNGSIMSDIAGQYKLHGDLDKAKYYIEKALKRKDNDDMTYANSFAINNDMENYPDALKALKTKSEMNKNKDYLLYQALLQFRDGKDFKTTLNEFLKSGSKDDDNIQLATKMLASSYTVDALDTLGKIGMLDAYKMLLYQYFVARFPNEFNPSFNYGDLLNYHQLYSRAIKVFKAMPKDKLDKEHLEGVNFDYAYALYMNRNFDEANKLWETMLSSSNFYYKSASAYFLGKYYLNKNQKEKAIGYFKMVSDKPSESKYANFCNYLVKK